MTNRYNQEPSGRAPNPFGSTMADLHRRDYLVQESVHGKIITPDTDPDRFTENETALFRQGKCGHQIEPGAMDIEREYCCTPSKMGASFGQCPEHDAELLLDYFPDGSPRHQADPRYQERPEYQERLAAYAALLPGEQQSADA